MSFPEPRSAQWANNPEPAVGEPDPQTILEEPTSASFVYLWNSANERTEWLQFEGETVEVEQ